jgi:hypothetical protein
VRHILSVLFGWPGTWGAGGNIVAWVLCGAIAGAWLRLKLNAHHAAQMAQSALHHRQQMAQAAAHHQETIELSEAHHADMKAHVTAVVAEQSEGISILSGATTAVLAAHVRGQEPGT